MQLHANATEALLYIIISYKYISYIITYKKIKELEGESSL